MYEFDTRGKICSDSAIKTHFQISTPYLGKALEFLSFNNLIKYEEHGSVSLTNEARTELSKSTTNSVKLVLDQLMEVQPFIEFTYFLGKGKTENDSIKLVSSLYNLSQQKDTLVKIFREWIKLLGITVSDSVVVNKTLEGLQNTFQNRLYANNFIKEFLKDDLHNISEQVLSELANAVRDIQTDNESSVNEAGRALEDFLRLDLATSIDLTHCNGIAQIGNELNKHIEFPQKLNNICVGLSNIRSMGKAHGVDKVLKTSWGITENSATGYIILVLSLIKSYLIYKNEGKTFF